MFAVAWYVFPAYAGMSPIEGAWGNLQAGFPRLRGDEPAARPPAKQPQPFSPPTRG